MFNRLLAPICAVSHQTLARLGSLRSAHTHNSGLARACHSIFLFGVPAHLSGLLLVLPGLQVLLEATATELQLQLG